MKKSIVTGGAGFIGSHLVDLLIEHNHEVVIIDNLASGNLKNIEHLKNTKSVCLIESDINNIESNNKDIQDADFVFHLAGLGDIRTEFGDIFLHAKAEFVISGASGNFHLASIFGTPSILTNSYHLEVIPMLNSDMSLPVIYKEKSSGNILCVSKMLSLGIELSSSDYLTKNEISLIPNSNEELLMAIKEMYENLYNKNFSFLPIHEENKINKLFKKNHIAYKKQGKICRYWLQKYNHIIY